MQVKARAVILVDGRLVVTRQRRRGQRFSALPGGRVRPGESVLEALARELREEVSVEIEPGGLVYIAEVIALARIHDLNLVFLASASGVSESERLEFIEPDCGRRVFPPLLEQIAIDFRDGFAETPRWLGSVWDPELGRIRGAYCAAGGAARVVRRRGPDRRAGAMTAHVGTIWIGAMRLARSAASR